MKDESFNAALSLSPDGQWLAYQSDQSGANEVYVAHSRILVPYLVVAYGLESLAEGKPHLDCDGREAALSGDSSIGTRGIVVRASRGA